MIPREVIDEIIRRTDLKQLIGSYVQLKRAGSNYVGLCPFHSEKGPSFTVFTGNHEGFYCFGCGAGGDAVTFIKRMENLDYVDAVEFLGKRAGVEVVNEGQSRPSGPSKDRIRELNTAAARLFHACLMDPKIGAPGMKYLKERQISDATIKHFYLGYSPDNGFFIHKRLMEQGFTEEELKTAFLCGSSSTNGKPYDYFRGRVIYPIVDTSRNIVAFGGRVIEDKKPKYLNTSDTPAFKKSKNLFALNYAKDYLADGLILCEGYMDVIALHQAGFQNAVATLGTAITEEHARIIAKYTGKVFLSYDSDGAGQNATSKAIRLLENVGVEVKIIRMSGAKDPDEFIKKKGAAAFRELLNGSVGNFDFRFEKILSNYSIDDPSEKLRAVADAAALVSEYSSSVERDIYSGRVCEKLGIREQPFLEDVKKKMNRKRSEFERSINSEAFQNARYLGDRVNPAAASNSRAASAEDVVLGMLLLFEEFRDAIVKGEVALEADDFYTPFGKRTFEAVMQLHSDPGGFEFSLLGETFSVEEMSRLEGLCVKRKDIMNNTAILISAVDILKEEKNKKESEVPANLGSGSFVSDLLDRKRAEMKQKNTR